MLEAGVEIRADVTTDPLQHCGVLGGGWELGMSEEKELTGGLFCVIAGDLDEVLVLERVLPVLVWFHSI